MKRLLALVLLLSCATVPTTPPALVEKPTPRPPSARLWRQPKAVVIRHATVMTANGQLFEDGAISFAEGKILAVGKNADVLTPMGAEEVDATGKVVTPGIIDVHSHMGVYAVPGTLATDDGNEATSPVTAEVSAEHAFWPQDPALRRAAQGGITSILVLPGSANLIGGRGFPVKLHFGRTPGEMRFPGAKDGVKIACGENPRRVYGHEKKVAPSTRMGNAAGYRQAFAAAKDYLARWDDWRMRARNSAATAGAPPIRDLRLETLGDVLRGDVLVQNHCYRADDMQLMLDVADEFGFKIRAFHHALDAYKIRDTLARKGVAVATWADWWGFKMEAWDGIPENAGLLSQAGGRAVIHSDSSFGVQRLNQEAAKAMWRARESGIPISDDEALRWVTANAAWVMGVDDRTGMLARDMMADVVIWNGSPFSVYARAEKVYADGVVTYDLATGAADTSDFEVGEAAAPSATLTTRPAPRVAFGATISAACDPAARSSCLPPLELSRDPEGCVAIVGATALVAGKPLANATVVLDGGKITRVEAGLAAPERCRVVDGKGKVVAPGFIEASTSMGLVEIDLEESGNDQHFRGDAAKEAVHAAVRASDSFNPGSAMLPVARLGGVTGAVATPDGGLVSGQSAYFTLDGALVKSPLAMSVNLGLAGHDALSSPRGAALERLRELLDDAREYGKRKADYEGNRMRRVAASRLDLEALQPVLAGKLPVVFRVDRVSDLRAVLALSKEFGLKPLLLGATEGWQLAAELAAAKVPVILRPSDNLPDNLDSLGARADNAALLAAAGVKVVVSTQNMPGLVRTLGQEAGIAVAFGLPYDEAIRAITSNVAEAYGLEGGRLSAGAPADVVLWSGDPLEVSSRPLATFIAGRQVSLESRQQALFRKYRTLSP